MPDTENNARFLVEEIYHRLNGGVGLPCEAADEVYGFSRASGVLTFGFKAIPTEERASSIAAWLKNGGPKFPGVFTSLNTQCINKGMSCSVLVHSTINKAALDTMVAGMAPVPLRTGRRKKSARIVCNTGVLFKWMCFIVGFIGVLLLFLRLGR
jgi:hypothetical protein